MDTLDTTKAVYGGIDPGDAPPEAYLQACTSARDAVLLILRHLYAHFAEATGVRDGGPVSQGALVGLLDFIVEGSSMDEAAVRAFLGDCIDSHLPQSLMNEAAAKAGAVGEGNA